MVLELAVILLLVLANGSTAGKSARSAIDRSSAIVPSRCVNTATGAGFDGLTANGPNRNRGAESTLAAVAAMSRADAGAQRV